MRYAVGVSERNSLNIYMEFYGKEQAIERINKLSADGRSFVFVINYAADKAYIEEPHLIDPHEILYDLNGFTNAPLCLSYTGETDWCSHPVSYLEYKRAFDVVMSNIRNGNSFLTNLTFPTPVRLRFEPEADGLESGQDKSLLELVFHRAKARYKLWMKDRFVCFSPEIFVRITDGRISSYPMKGTIDASLPNARELLLNDPKEAAEHATITDLIRNDLSMVASQVSVTRYRYIDELQTLRGRLLQASSEIGGVLPADYAARLGDILYSLLPAGSITGAPKCKTVAVIAEAEKYDRGFYTGIAGYCDGRNLDSAVMIRYIEQSGDNLIFKSGGGITFQSNPENEYEEMKQKIYVPIY